MKDRKLKKIIEIISDNASSLKQKCALLEEYADELFKSEIFSDFVFAQKMINTAQRKQILATIGFILCHRKQFPEAIEFLEKTYRAYESRLSYKEKTDILEKLSFSLEKNNEFRKALKYSESAKKLSEIKNKKSDITFFCSTSGSLFAKLYDYRSALRNFQTAYKTSVEIKDERSIAVTLNHIGTIYIHLSNYEKALEYFLRSHKIREKSADAKAIAVSLNNIGMLYYRLKNYEKALQFMKKAHKIETENSNRKGIVTSLNNMGIIYDEIKEFDQALKCHREALRLREELGDTSGISTSLNNIGNVYLFQQKYRKSLESYLQALKIREKLNDRRGIALISINVGNIYNKLEDYQTAFSYLQKSGKIAKEIESRELQRDNLLIFSEYYAGISDHKKALICFRQYSDLKDDIEREKNSKRIAEMQINFEIEQQEKEEKIEDITDKCSLISKELEERIEKNFIGESPSIKSILKETLKAAEFPETNVIITGESGTGKEIIARIIHHASDRKSYNFCPINCSAIPDTLLESEFFGHRKGVFTGAVEDKKGLFELADKGTLFLDEIADMPLSLQAKLLRAIEEQKIKKIGYQKEIFIDVRLIAATNQNIRKLVNEKKFRLDLFHRLNTLMIDIPPLRERPEDIEPLVKHFINIFIRKINKFNPKIDRSLFDFLKKYDFPGNVRELKNLVERALIICDNNCLDQSCFPLLNANEMPEKITTFNIKKNEELLIRAALQKTGFNQSKAARMLGISRHTLMRRMGEMRR